MAIKRPYQGKGPILWAELYRNDDPALSAAIAEHSADKTKRVVEHPRAVKAEGIEFLVTIVIVRRRLEHGRT